MSTNETGTGTGATEVRSVQQGTMKELLANQDAQPRKCSNPVWIFIFWAHFVGMIVLIYLGLTQNGDAAGGVLDFFTKYLIGDGSGRKILGAMLGCCVTGGIWSFIWVRFLQCFKENPIKISLYLYHFLVLCMVGVAFWQSGWQYVLYFYGAQLLITDLVLYLQRENFPFTESLLRVGLGAVVANSKMQCVAYAFMPFQIILYIFWALGGVFCLAWKPDNWYFWIVLFMTSYNWVGYFFHFIVHTFVTVLSGFWIMGLKDGYSKASSSCKMAFTTSMGPIALSSAIMAVLAFIRTIISIQIRILSCCVCYSCMYKACCGWLEAIIARFNEYVLAYVALRNIEFGQGSKALVNLFATTGMKIIVNEIGWDVTIQVGVILGFCVSGGVGIALHIILWGSEFSVEGSDAELVIFCFFCLYGLLGMTTTSVGLVPLRSALTAVFVIWAEEPGSFAAGQPEYYNDLMAAVEKCPSVKEYLKPLLESSGSNERTV